MIFTGKGGVGKTTLSAAFAHLAGRTGKKALFAQIRSSKNLLGLYGIHTQNNGPLPLGPNTDWINLNPKDALETYAMQTLKLRSVYQAVFEQRSVTKFLRAVPALGEILILGHLVHIIEQGRYDLTVLDAPSSISGSLMLSAPRTVMETAPDGPLQAGARWIHRTLSDRHITVINLVTTPEELPVNEAMHLHKNLTSKLGLPPGMLYVNRLIQDPFAAFSDKILKKAITAMQEIEPGRIYSHATAQLRAHCRLQKKYLALAEAKIDLPTINLPDLIRQTNAIAIIDELTQRLSQHIEDEVCNPARS